ncbi:SGF29 tudor-like domain-containing protein [Bisporella sp. PMI_857]|nr:SGF29 tudor-like domain-containing protein [Bisporella sp. PMI_857]
MSSASRNRAARGNAQRPDQSSNAELLNIWENIQDKLNEINKITQQEKENSQELIKAEITLAEKRTSGSEPSPSELDVHSALFRAGISYAEKKKNLAAEATEWSKVLLEMQKAVEEAQGVTASRTSVARESRGALDSYDGPTDSPGPSAADNKHVRKITAGRTSSQPPRDRDEKEEKESSNSGRTKILFQLGAEVAFKPKIPGQTKEHDWIQGIVTKVIGEGKSRRYDVQDPFPDEVTGKQGESYRSSASSMVTIPPVGTPLQDYEVGKRVLALYPETTTFYRADVKAMLEGGSKVQLLFEDEPAGALKIVDRRFVLDHKG